VNSISARSNIAFLTANLAKQYRLEKRKLIPVLADVNLRVDAGEWLALVGASGSGKSTLLHLLGALDRPSSGAIACFGQDYARLKAGAKAVLRRDLIGFVFQTFHLFPELSAWENVMLPALQWQWNKTAAKQRARQLLVDFGLEQRLQHRPPELSGGEQQRTALARALINNPRILLADEPTGNLDAEASANILGLLQQLHRDGKTIIMVTHDAQVAGRADRILRLRDGAIEDPA